MKIIGIITLVLMFVGCISVEDKSQSTTNPMASEYNTRLGLAYIKRGDLQRAKRKLLTSLKQDPKSVEGHLAMAYYWEQIHDNKQAEQEYRQALKLNSRSGQVRNNFGVFLCRNARYSEADSHFKAAAHDREYIKTGEMFENAGLCAQKAGQLSQAKYYFKKAISQDHTRYNSLVELAQIELDNNNAQETDRLVAMYHNYFKPTPRTLLLGYWASTQMGKTKQANQYAKQLNAEYPESEEAKKLKG